MASKMTYKELEQWLKEKTTELKEANAALKQEKEEHKFKIEQLQNIFDQSPDLICVGDSRANIKIINPSFRRILGYAEEEMLSKPFLEFIHPDDREKSAIILEKVLYQGDKASFFENRWLSKDGSTRWFSWTWHIDKKAGESYTIGRDITKRKLAEEALRKTHDELEKKTEELQKIFDLSLDLILIADLHGNIKRFNPSFESILGYTEKELLSKPILEFIHPDDREKSAILIEQSLYKGEDVSFFENRWLSKDGSARWFGWTGYSDKKAGERYAIGRDITEQKLAEEELRRAHDELEKKTEELQKIFDLSLDLICIGDFQGNITKINPALERTFGYTVKELLSKPYLEFAHPDDRENLAILAEQSLHKGENVPYFENRWLSKDGSTRWVGLTAYSDEKAGEIYAIGRDITERKLIEEELRKAHDELEKRVEERTEELDRANAELKKQTHNLEETNAALKIVLRQREQDKKELEEKVVSNVKEMVLPFVEKLNKKLPDDTLQVYLDIIKSHLEDITGPFTHQLFSKYSDLTPSEIKIAGLVKDGKTTKEIAELLDASRDTVSFHRRSLRKKLDLRNRKINLRAHLSSLT